MKTLRWLDLHLEECVLTVLLIILSCLVTVNVVLRYILGTGLTWSDAVCRYCLVYSTFFTIGHWVRREAGISVDFVTQIVPRPAAELFRWAVYVLQVLFFSCLFFASVTVMRTVYAAGMKDGTMGFNMAYIYFACCIGFLNAAIRSVQVFILHLPMFRKEEKEG